MKEVFVKHPNIPSGRASLVLASGRNPDVIRELSALGIRSIDTVALEGISGSERYHADMTVLHTGGNGLFCAANARPDVISALRNEGFDVSVTMEPVSAVKPALNLCIIGKNVLCDTRYADRDALSRLKSYGYAVLHTNQRYTKCSCAVVSGNALITSDPSVIELCKGNGIDVLGIRAGYIRLDGYDHGFIGGCCGLISEDTLAFSGNISLHPDFGSMKSFAADHGVSLLSLSGEELYDIGGIIPVKTNTSGAELTSFAPPAGTP